MKKQIDLELEIDDLKNELFPLQDIRERAQESENLADELKMELFRCQEKLAKIEQLRLYDRKALAQRQTIIKELRVARAIDEERAATKKNDQEVREATVHPTNEKTTVWHKRRSARRKKGGKGK